MSQRAKVKKGILVGHTTYKIIIFYGNVQDHNHKKVSKENTGWKRPFSLNTISYGRKS